MSQDIVVVGAGKLGLRHAESYRSIAAARVVGVVEPEAARRDAIAGSEVRTLVTLW